MDCPTTGSLPQFFRYAQTLFSLNQRHVSKGHKVAPQNRIAHTFVFHRCSDEAGSSGLHIRQCRQEPDTQLSFSTTFREKDLSYQSHVYSRMSNPTRNLWKKHLDLEYGSSCCAFASGNAATSSLITAVGPRTHIVIGTDVYHGTRSLLENVFSQWGQHTVRST